MAFDIEGAKKAGYSDSEIADYLAAERKYDAGKAREAGYSDADIIKHLATPSVGQAFMRGLGLGTRDVIEGAGKLPGMVYDAVRAPVAMATQGINAATGAELPVAPPSGELLTGTADALGLPRAVTRGERLRSDVGQAVAGLIPSMGAGAALQGAASPVAQKIGAALTTAPAAQIGGAIGTGAGEGLARENGYGPAAQFGAALAGGVTGAMVPTVAGMVGQGLSAATQPFRQGGREKIIGEALLRNSSDPQTLAQRLREGADDPARRLPGSPVTAGVAARDPQMMILEGGLRSDVQTVPGSMSPAAALRDVDALRNANRLKIAQNLMQSGDDVAARGATLRNALVGSGEGDMGAEEAMKALTRQMYEKAALTEDRFPVKPLLDKINEVNRTYFGTLSGGVPAELKSIADDLAALTQPKAPPGPRSMPSSLMLGSMSTPVAPPSAAASTVDWDALQNLYSRVGKIVGNAKSGTEKDARVVAAGGKLRELIDELGSTPEWVVARAQRSAQGSALGRDQSGTNAIGRALMEDGFGAPMMPDAKVPGVVISDPGSVRQALSALDKGIADARAANLSADQVRALSVKAADAKVALRDQFIDDMIGKSQTTSDIADAAGNVTRQLSPAQFRRFWDKNAPVAQLLFPKEHLDTLKLLANDFAESTVSNTARARGSDTAQNLSVGNFIARLTGGVIDPQNPMAQTLGNMGPVAKWILGAPEQAMREMLVQAMRDPKFAAQLVEGAGPKSLERAMLYWQKTMPERVRDAMGEAVTRQVPRVGLAMPAESQNKDAR